ncbi:interferon-induced, double-stranded RNA-activated protein kinase-like [Eleutherodactylus coqui]|uniref:interferon-induced, double-stranded RNA-activated protein kinase-like n=1 Tax=Eleutherodactylus coqui TaxID=57060 RepID=UPI0034635C89
MAEQNYKGMLIRHCDMSGLSFRFDSSKAGLPHDPRFTSYVYVNEEMRGEGQDKTKRGAENLACKVALLSLQNQDQGAHEAVQPVGNAALAFSPEVLNIRLISSPPLANGAACNVVSELNYIGLFNEFCQRNHCLQRGFADDQRGPPHMPEFFSSAVIGGTKYPEATGKNKKEARKNAAYLALKLLKPKYPEDLQLQQIPGLDDVEEAEGTSSKSTSSEERSSSEQKTESESAAAESSDSQITFHSSAGGTPSVPSRPHRRIALAPKFTNWESIHDVTTTDKSFQRDFDNITKLDSGGFGIVYKARKKLDQKYYVVKKVKRRSEKDENEIKTLASLEHKNIVRYYHAWAGEDTFSDQSSSGHIVESLFIQMEWCAAGTLEKWIIQMGTVDKFKSLAVFRQIIDGVEFIHSNNLIHRDLKPANILLTENMIVKIADFGLVTPVSGKDQEESLLRTVGRGTESYMAPEQENASYENEVDIFPLGLILIELFWKLDDKYKASFEWERLRNAELPPKFIQQYPSEESMIKLMLSKDPKKRPKASYLKTFFGEEIIYQSKTR